MICLNCKKEISEDFTFCPFCGKKIKTAAAKRKHGNGQGSVYKRGKTWTAAKVFGYDASGKAIRATRGGFLTAKEAREYLSMLQPKNGKISLSEAFNAAMEKYKAAPKTEELQRSGFAYLSPFHNRDISTLTIDELQGLFDLFDVSKSYQEKIKRSLHMAYQYAIPRGFCDKDLSAYIKICGEAGTRDAFTREELEKIRQAIGKVPEADLIYIHCFLGYRPTELLTRRIETHYLPEERAIFGGSKTEAGKYRVVTISPKIAPLVEKRIGQRKTGFIFCQPDGKPYSTNLYYRHFMAVMDALGIKSTKDHKITPYSCRHTFATMADRVTGGEKAKLELMGHKSAEMLRHYQHADFEDLRKITDAL